MTQTAADMESDRVDAVKLPTWAIKRVLGYEHHPYYMVRHAVMDGSKWGCQDFEMKEAYDYAGQYIGDPKDAKYLTSRWVFRWKWPFIRRGPAIEYFERRREDSNVVSVGYSPTRQKWYGWSHRAIFGFGVGYEVKEGDITEGRYPPGYVVRTFDDARKMAEAFAEGVG